jgi:hypothetical protein
MTSSLETLFMKELTLYVRQGRTTVPPLALVQMMRAHDAVSRALYTSQLMQAFAGKNAW